MTEPKWCPHCGAQHEGAVALCEKCRAAGVVAAPPPARDQPVMLPAPEPFAAPPKSKAGPTRALVAAVGAVAVAGAAAAALLWWPAKMPAPGADAPRAGAPGPVLAAEPPDEGKGEGPAPFRDPVEPRAAATGQGPAPFRDPVEPSAAATVQEPLAARDPAEPRPPVGIAGEYWRETEPPGRPRKLSLCPDGRYFEYSAKLGRWSTAGSDEGKLAIALDSGKSLELPFRILREPRTCSPAGCDAEFDGVRYGRDPTLGNCQ